MDGVTGWLIPACDVGSIAAGLTRALNARGGWAEMGRAGRARVEAAFSARRFETEARAVVEAEIIRFGKLTPSGVGDGSV